MEIILQLAGAVVWMLPKADDMTGLSEDGLLEGGLKRHQGRSEESEPRKREKSVEFH